jgi:hypothetical protein
MLIGMLQNITKNLNYYMLQNITLNVENTMLVTNCYLCFFMETLKLQIITVWA